MLTARENHAEAEVVKTRNPRRNPIEKTDFRIHAFNKAASNAMGEKVEDVFGPICQGIAKGMEGRKGELTSALNPLKQSGTSELRRGISLIPVMQVLA